MIYFGVVAVLLNRLFTFFTMVTFLLGVRRRPLLARPIAEMAERKPKRKDVTISS